jgi:hypothetical protein
MLIPLSSLLLTTRRYMSRDSPSMWLLEALYLDLVPRYRYVYTEEQPAYLFISLFVYVCMHTLTLSLCMHACEYAVLY